MTFIPNYIRAKFKTKEDAMLKILENIQNTPGTADLSGEVGLMLYGTFITIKPVKKKPTKEL